MYAFLRRTEKNIRNIIFLCFAQEGIHALHCTIEQEAKQKVSITDFCQLYNFLVRRILID